jgi:amino acid transporter
VLSAISIGILYVFTTYAVDVAFGPGKFINFGSAGPASWVGVARTLYGLFWFFVFLAIVNSTIANANAGTNISSRIGFAMGRIRAFPHAMVGTGIVILQVLVYIVACPGWLAGWPLA